MKNQSQTIRRANQTKLKDFYKKGSSVSRKKTKLELKRYI